MKVGDLLTWTRTFSEEDIRLFAQLSGDEGERHLVPDEKGRLMAHGLLTATIPTKIGGDMNFIAREMLFQFHRPVFGGDTIHCDVTVDKLEPDEQFLRIETSFICRNQHGKEVMTGRALGMIRNGR